MRTYQSEFLSRVIFDTTLDLVDKGQAIHVGEWQGLRGKGIPQEDTIEIQNVVFEAPIPLSAWSLQDEVKATQPWAEDHFLERVSGTPYNPPPSASYWNKDKEAVDEHRTIEEGGEMKYSHTYPERFWPREAWVKVNGEYAYGPYCGIRFQAGDLSDVVDLLVKSPFTRQAYLPVWFPEDTGAVHGERVPCTLGYHFLFRDNMLHVAYHIRSCDAVRHFRNDIYLTCRLVHWVIEECSKRDRAADRMWDEVRPGNLCMWIGSFHCFAAERSQFRRKIVER